MKAYLAGQSQCYKAISQVAEHMQQWGYEFTEPWWLTAEAAQFPDSPEAGCLPAAYEIAEDDIAGVEAAEVVFAIIDLDVGHGRGLWFEIGYAVAKQKPVHVLLVGAHYDGDLIQELVFLTATTSWMRQPRKKASTTEKAEALHRMVNHERAVARKWQKVDGDTPSMHIKEEEA